MKINCKHKLNDRDKISETQLIDLLLSNRQIKDKKEFLHPKSPLELSLTDFGFKKEFQKTLKYLTSLKSKNKMIVVYTDYDADGITGGAILWETLFLLGFKVMPYVPHRKLEGYGFSQKGIDAVKKLYNPSLIISVDHGITAKDKVAYAKKLGIPIIITDHHLKPDKLPKDALAIFHIPDLSGSGVAYFFAKEIFMSLRGALATKQSQNNQIASLRNSSLAMTTLEQNFATDYLALASIGSIADLVPLIGPTRSVVKFGLEAFSKIKRVGLKHILRQAGIEGRKITPYEIGFIIAPRINAVGRLEHAIDALRLLCTTSEEKAAHLAGKIGDQNKQRQDLVKSAVIEAKNMVETQTRKLAKPAKLPKLIILENKNWHEGIIGLIASKICEEFYRPTIVLTESDGFLKGSARSISSFHITNFLGDLKQYLIDVGGHKGAAGFTIEKSKFGQFAKSAKAKAEKLISVKDLEKTIDVDLKTSVSQVSLELTKAMEQLAPFGIGNPRPTFYSEVELEDAKLFGKNNDHMKIFVKDLISTSSLELVSFFNAQQFTKLARNSKIQIVYSLEIDRWGGNEKLRGKMIQLIVR